ncbi:hypothetical protein SAMN05518865_111153 [Duganella sp. CF458]|uniref:hypothetical protein n=1 Tax=Duganella sp. CF458 TaxID=1884368 RepID=UPI0008EE3715|nr:hypothetical protein [Duganella sp. CF458]SFG37962.1 hypothetical protein SAMN05518865_111153 [Duganella sp. CF458]
MLPTLCMALSAPTLRAFLEFQGEHSGVDPAIVRIMSPNQFVQLSLGSTRSAWHAIHSQMPGSREWTLALRLRYAQEAEARRAAYRAAKAEQEQANQTG